MKKVLDISVHNGNIDFDALKQTGINDLIIRAGWLGNYNNHEVDETFERNYSEALRLGFNIGIYVYSYCRSKEAVESGCNWLSNLLVGKNINLPVFLDLEDDYTLDGSDLTEQAVTFCEYFKNKGYKAGVYANKYWFQNYLNVTALEQYKIWLAEWQVTEPTVSFKVDLWQYTSKDRVYGINGNVDASYCMCECDDVTPVNPNEDNKKESEDYEEMKKYVNGTTEEPIYADTDCTVKVGVLFPHGECDCLGVFEGKAILRYNIYDNNGNVVNHKIGFANWLGGIQE